MEFDDLFAYIGEFGTYQLVLFLTLGLLSFHPGWQNMGMAILGASMDHWCTVDGLEGLPYEEQKRLGIPYDSTEEEYEQCDSYIRDFTNYTDYELCYGNFSDMSTDTQECSQWTYDRTEFAEFPVSKFELVCEDTYLISLSSTIYMVGLLVGAPLSGILSDKFGRFPLMMVGIVLHIIFGVCAAYSQDYWSFTMSRFVISAAAHCAYLCGFVILMEITGPRYRSIIGCLFQMHFSIGYMLLPVMAYFIRDSTKLMMCMAIPVVASLFMAIMIPESPRWLVNKERYEDAKHIIQQVAAINKVELPEKLDFADASKKVEKGKFLDIFRYSTLRKNILIIYLGWFCNSLLYYGLGLNAGTLSGSIFVNVFIGGAVEIPAVLVSIWGMYYFGRRPTLAWGFIVAAAANFLCIPFLNNDDLAILVTIFSALGKACIKLTFCVIYVYTAELFPTPVRHLAVGSSSMMSRFGGLLAPFMGEPMLQIWDPLPSIIFGVVALASGVLSFLLPETLGKEMPDTFEEAIEIAKKYSGAEIDINAAEDGLKERPSSAGSRVSKNKVDVMNAPETEIQYETPYQNAPGTQDSTL